MSDLSPPMSAEELDRQLRLQKQHSQQSQGYAYNPWPPDYWAKCRHHYFRDHADTGAWGVRDDTSDRIVTTGLDKSVAAAIACLLNGDVGLARSCLASLPERLPKAP